jgi:pimeloyl-ACP methyl ester carboxylesterase
VAIAVGVAGIALALAAPPVPASAKEPEPDPNVSAKEIAAALTCNGPLDNATQTPVLLLHGTGASPGEFAWNYEPALTARRIPWCHLAAPKFAMGDIQRNGELVVAALRVMHGRAGRTITIYGHSQGGMVARYALRFFPSTRLMVEDLVGAAPSNHGTIDADLDCALLCPAAHWQQRTRSNLLAALNSPQETYAGIDYTTIYTRTDEMVVPNFDAATGSSSLRTGDGAMVNIAIQDICPLALDEHLWTGTGSATGWALFWDAYQHDGPASPARIDRRVCLAQAMPGVNRTTVATDAAATVTEVAVHIATAQDVPAEPPLRCYAAGTPCPSGT